MKRIILAGAIALCGFSNAQITKGTVYISGEVGYDHKEDNNFNNFRKYDVFKILPTVGYFVDTNLAVGLGVGYKSAVTKFEYENVGVSNILEIKDTDNAFVVAPFVRKYWTLSDKLYIFGQLQVPLEFGQDKFDVRTAGNMGDPILNPEARKRNYTSIGVNVKPGLDYFLSKNWSIEATIGEFGYNTSKVNVDEAKRVNDYKFGLNLSSVTFGVKYIFAK